MTRLTTLADPEAVAVRATEEITDLLTDALDQRGVAHLALSGGTTPGRAYELLGEAIDSWDRVGVWFADERCVPADDPESNFRMASQTLLATAGIATGNVHRMRGELGPCEGARRYAQILASTVPTCGDGLPILDVVVLGIGPDGHVASLFPNADALQKTGRGSICLGVEDSPKPPPERITLGLDVLLAARRCVLLATGAEKAGALMTALGEPSRETPASLLRRDRLTVIADDAAAPGADRK